MEERLRDALAAANPVPDDQIEACVDEQTMSEMAQAVVRRRPAARKRPLIKRRLIWVAVVAVLAFPAASLGWGVSTHTGWFGSGKGEDVGRSEFLRTDAPDFRAAIGKLVPSVPLPAGATWNDDLDLIAEQGRANPSLEQEIGFRSTLEAFARCAWLKAVQSRTLSGDSAGAEAAARVFNSSLDWPATVATWVNGRDFIRNSVGSAALAGRLGPVEQYLSANCTGLPLEGVR